MFDTVECPYCEHENDISDGTVDLRSDNKFEHECENCGKKFDVFVEFEPSYRASEIETINCKKCGNEYVNKDFGMCEKCCENILKN